MTEKLKCSLCDKEATVHLTQIINHKIHKFDLCESCAQDKGVTDPEGFALADLLQDADIGLPRASDANESSCPVCGYTHADFQRSGRFGCSDCYTAFSAQLDTVLTDMHTGLRHAGKAPTLALQRQSSRLSQRNLQEALTRAIAEEDYEQAATLRDEIRAFEAPALEKEGISTRHD